jgi:hypothetical protein
MILTVNLSESQKLKMIVGYYFYSNDEILLPEITKLFLRGNKSKKNTIERGVVALYSGFKIKGDTLVIPGMSIVFNGQLPVVQEIRLKKSSNQFSWSVRENKVEIQPTTLFKL